MKERLQQSQNRPRTRASVWSLQLLCAVTALISLHCLAQGPKPTKTKPLPTTTTPSAPSNPTAPKGNVAATPADAAKKPPSDPAATPALVAGSEAAVAAYDTAVNTFKYQDFDNAIPQLRALLYPTPKVDAKREWRLREYLGAALWWQSELREASDEFTALLVRNPQARLDPAQYPPKMISDFDSLRANLLHLGVIKDNNAHVEAVLAPVEKIEPPPYGLMLFPMGVGQFANRQPTKGTAFLVAEGLLGSVSLGIFVGNSYAVAHGGNKSTSAETVMLSTGATFWLVAAWGVVDAILHYDKERPALVPPR